MPRLQSVLRVYPTLLRIGFAEMLAYRAQLLTFALTATIPLVNLALWYAVVRNRPLGHFGQADVIAYFLAAAIVQQLTGTKVAWVLNQEIGSGYLSMRLLRPLHPLLGYSAEDVSTIPMRALLSLPLAWTAFALAGGHFAQDGALWLAALGAIVAAWLIQFLVMSILGSLAFFIDSSRSFMYAWQALAIALSGYLFPLDFMSFGAPGAAVLMRRLPFYYMTGFPIELMLGLHDRMTALRGLGFASAYVLALAIFGHLLWRAGLRRWNAYGA